MKKSHREHDEPSNPLGSHVVARPARDIVELISNAKGLREKRAYPAVVYEEDDLRGIVAEALARSSEPHRALSEVGVIKNAAEFFYNGVK